VEQLEKQAEKVFSDFQLCLLSADKGEGKESNFGDMFANLNAYQYRAMVIADFNLQKYRYIIANYDILEITQMFVWKTSYKMMQNGL
jgi:hypothetical protein